jgi:3-phenylpropionate/trans-cinnamate dioxygenase ferredoxin reductase subunit
MPDYKYLIIGAGMAADAAVRGIRELDSGGSIGLLGAENDPPYNRPPLSKGLWKGKPLAKIWRGTTDQGATLHLGHRAVALNAAQLSVEDDAGTIYKGERLLLATGGTPNRLPFGGDNIIYFRTVGDYRKLRKMIDEDKKEFAVVGSGFIGSEIAAALSLNDRKVSMLFPGEGISAGAFPRDLSQFLNDFYRQKGVDVLAGDELSTCEPRGERLILRTEGGRELAVDGVIAGIGIRPNVELAAAAGLMTGDGVAVDDFLVTSAPQIYAAGDVAEFFDPALGKRRRVEHEDNANTMGRLAGRNMAGAGEAYEHLPYLYSDLFELGYEAVGELDARLEIVEDWKERFKKGVVYYLEAGRVRGVLLWNFWDTVTRARALVAQDGPFTPRDLQDRL